MDVCLFSYKRKSREKDERLKRKGTKARMGNARKRRKVKFSPLGRYVNNRRRKPVAVVPAL